MLVSKGNLVFGLSSPRTICDSHKCSFAFLAVSRFEMSLAVVFLVQRSVNIYIKSESGQFFQLYPVHVRSIDCLQLCVMGGWQESGALVVT